LFLSLLFAAIFLSDKKPKKILIATQFLSMKPLLETLSNLDREQIENIRNPYYRREDLRQLKYSSSFLLKFERFQAAVFFCSDKNRYEDTVPGQSDVYSNPDRPRQFLFMKHLLKTPSNGIEKRVAKV